MGQRNRIAETLRSARERTGLTVEQVAADAGIPAQYVRLLEGETHVRVGIADELYLIPFFRRYTAFLNLDTNELLPEFVSVVQDMTGEGNPPLTLAYQSSWRRVWRGLAVVAAIAIAAVVILVRSPDRGPPRDDRTLERLDEPAGDRVAGVAPEDAVPPGVSAGPTAPLGSPAALAAAPDATPSGPAEPAATGGVRSPAPGGATSATATRERRDPTPAASPRTEATGAGPGPAIPAAAPAAAGPPRELRIEATEDAWISLGVDDRTRTSVYLKAGESRTWTGSAFALTVGNAGGVSVSLDGEPLPALGPSGKVVRIQLPREAPAGTRATGP